MGGDNEKDDLMSLIEKYKNKFPETLKELGNNVIYYDPNYGKSLLKYLKMLKYSKI